MRLRTAFMGSPEFAVASLAATAATTDVQLVVSQPDRPAGRGQKLTACAVKEAAVAMGLPTLQPEKVRDPNFVATLRELDLDLIVVVAYGKILQKELLELARFGCINVHASLLPRWRGAAPIQRAIASGDRVTGVCLMALDEGCDTGPVYVREPLVIGEEDTSGTLTTRLAALGGKTLEKFLRNFEARPALQAQDHALATHAAKLQKAEGNIAWRRSAKLVAAHIRGMDPWPAAMAQRGEEVYRVFGAKISGDFPVNQSIALPGQIVAIGEASIGVAAATGVVEIHEMQAAGKRRMTAAAFCSGNRWKVGDGFDDPYEPPADDANQSRDGHQMAP